MASFEELGRERRRRNHPGGQKEGRGIGYCHLEKLRDREALPGYGFTTRLFPVEIRDASTGWTRAVAVPDD